MKLCCIFNTPSIYRESIYKLINKTYECHWYFEDTDNRLKTFDTKLLSRVSILHSKKLGAFYWVKGTIKLLYNNEYNHYLMMGHSRCLSTLCFLLIKKFFFPHKKTYLWTHGFYGKESRIDFFWKKLFFNLANELFIYGNYACELMVSIGFKPEKLHAIHNSLNYDIQLYLRNKIRHTDIYQSHFGNTNYTIVFIGRLTIIKNLGLLLKAIANLKQKDLFYNLVLIGDGTEKEYLLSLSKELNIVSQIWFYGACYDERTNAELIYNADLCVSPGNVGLTAMHSMMFGCPVITHNDFAHQMPEFEVIKPNITGNFFEKDNIESLADAISKWFKTNGNCREHIRKECYKIIDSEWNPIYQINIIKSTIK